VVADAYSQSFVLAGLLTGVPVLGSFHTDLIDLLRSHGAFFFQEWFVLAKEAADSLVLDSAATTSKSFQVQPVDGWSCLPIDTLLVT
jgi:hypothetical protein